MAIEQTSSGVLFTGEHTKVQMWITLMVGVKYEVPGGMKMTRGIRMKTRACDLLGISRNTKKEKVMELLQAKVDAMKMQADAIERAKKAQGLPAAA